MRIVQWCGDFKRSLFLFTFSILVFGSHFFVPSPVYSQHSGFKYFKNYTPDEYRNNLQNWWILQDKRGIMYVANNGGVLEFDGVSWRSISVPHKVVRSLAIDDNGRIYVGGNNEFGYLAPDSMGTLHYVTLRDGIENQVHRNFTEVQKTYSTKEGIYFQTKEFLFRKDRDSRKISVCEAKERFFLSFKCKGKLFIRQQYTGLMQMVNDSLVNIHGSESFAETSIYMIVPYDSQAKEVLIGTGAGRFYRYDGKTTSPFPTEADDYLKKNKLYHGIRLSSGDFAMATLRGGVVIMDSQGMLKDILTKNYGLLDDDVKYVFEDRQGNLWLALSSGISKIEYCSPFSVYDNRSNLPEQVMSVVKHRNELYAGTTRGLYFFVSSSLATPGKFKKVPRMTGNCRSLLSIGNFLLVASSDGLSQFEGRKNIKHTVIKKNSHVLSQSGLDKNRVWVGTREGLFSIYFDAEKGRWKKEYQFKNITPPIYSIVEDKKGSLWLGTLTQGVIKVDFPIDNPSVTRYDEFNGLSLEEVHVFHAAGCAMFATKKGIFRFKEDKRFIPYKAFGDRFTGGPQGKSVFRIVEGKGENIWLHSMYRNFLAFPGPDGTFAVNKNPFRRIPLVQVNVIYPDPDEEIVWLGSAKGLFRYDARIKKNCAFEYGPIIRKVVVNGKLIYNGHHSGQSFPEIEYKDRNIRFEYAGPFFEDESSTKYSCYLEGYDEDWHNWNSETKKDYTNLDPGVYRFRIQALNVYWNKSREAEFKFKVLPPWYRTWWAFIFYAVLGGLWVFLIVKWRSGKLKREKRKLEQIVKERTKEIEERTEEINRKNLQLEMQTAQLKDQSGKLKEMDMVKSRFFANISHEFRTPLTLIMGPLEQMLSKRPGKEQKKQLNMMLRNSQRLFGLINQLLELSRFDSGKIKLQACRQNIIPFLRGLVASFEAVADKNELELTFHADEEYIPLYFDAEKLEEVVFNLLSNAVKFTPPRGKIIVSVKITKIDTKVENFSLGSLDISVCDTGPGIPREQLARIFDRFYQSESTHKHHQQGSGIGLAIAKELVELHRGRIDAHSSEGKGTEFIVRLPMGSAHLESGEIVVVSTPPLPRKMPPEIQSFYKTGPGVPGGAGTAPGFTGSNETDAAVTETDIAFPKTGKNIILVVEDSADVRDYIRGALQPSYNVAEAADGQEGIRKAQELIPDLIISDIMMPKKDGYELCRVLKQDVQTSHIPVVLLTAKASEESIIQGLKTGADDYITKPFNTKILCVRIKNLIDLRRQLQRKIQRQMMMQPAEIAVSSIDESFLKEFRDTIEKNMSDPEFDIDQLCKTLYMGRATVFRKVHALTGETPKQFIQSYRLERAAKLLKANFGNVTEVAFEVGFSSSAYFTKCFKEKFHQLPSTFQGS